MREVLEVTWITDNGFIVDAIFLDSQLDRTRRELGVLQLNRQDAEDELRTRQLVMKAKKSQKGFKLNWKNEDEEKHYLYYNPYLDRVIDTSTYTYNVPTKPGYWIPIKILLIGMLER